VSIVDIFKYSVLLWECGRRFHRILFVVRIKSAVLLCLWCPSVHL